MENGEERLGEQFLELDKAKDLLDERSDRNMIDKWKQI